MPYKQYKQEKSPLNTFRKAYKAFEKLPGTSGHNQVYAGPIRAVEQLRNSLGPGWPLIRSYVSPLCSCM